MEAEKSYDMTSAIWKPRKACGAGFQSESQQVWDPPEELVFQFEPERED